MCVCQQSTFKRVPIAPLNTSITDGTFEVPQTLTMERHESGRVNSKTSRHRVIDTNLSDDDVSVPSKKSRRSVDSAGSAGVTPVSIADSRISSTPPPQPRRPQTGLEGLAERYTLGRILGMGTYG
mgnify:CR=1 FL=1